MDIVERLREFVATDCCSQRKEAADTIEQLQSTIKMQASDISLLRLANSVLRSERNRMKKENRELKGKK